MDVTICDARSAHLPQLEALECACFSAPWTRAQLASQLPDDRHVFLIAAAGETVLGYANFLHVLDEGDIGNVAVAPEYRRQGVAAALLERAIDDARTQGRKGLVLTCKDKLVHYYAKFGFVSEGVSGSTHGSAVWYQMRLKF